MKVRSRPEPRTWTPPPVGQKNGRFGGLPLTPRAARVVVIPVPWEVTVSNRSGTADGPRAILAASPLMDFFDPRIPRVWELAPAYLAWPRRLERMGERLRKQARRYLDWLEHGQPRRQAAGMARRLAAINRGCAQMVRWVERTAECWLGRGKLVGVVGGDHSTPLGLIRALARRESAFGVLHLDAHMDLRPAYEGFVHSHGSIMHNVLGEQTVTRLVQVGIRDFCEEEATLARRSRGRVVVFGGREIHRELAEGRTWRRIVGRIVSALPRNVYVSFDVDVLEPWLCPGTGTAVPGGLDFEQVFLLLEELVGSGRRIVGFDLTEVAPGPHGWDGAVGARALFRLSVLAALSAGRR